MKNTLKNHIRTEIEYDPIKQERKPYYMLQVEKHGDIMNHVWVFLAFIGLMALFIGGAFLAILIFKGGYEF